VEQFKHKIPQYAPQGESRTDRLGAGAWVARQHPAESASKYDLYYIETGRSPI
jgi:hypothetical protein